MTAHISGLGVGLLVENNVGLLLGLILVGLRAYGAREINGRWRWDFIWISITIILHLVNSFLIDYAVHIGLGLTLADIPAGHLPKIIRWSWIVVLISLPPTVIAKFSVVSLLLQLQGPQAKKRKLALYILAISLALVTTIAILLALFQCDPLSKLWNILEDGKCLYKRQAFDLLVFQGAFSAFTDVILALWPITIVWNLKMSNKSKISFCLLMAISIFAIAAAVQKCILTVRTRSSLDPTPKYARVIIWGSIEQWLIVILGSIPPLRPLFLRIFFKQLPYASQGSGNPSGYAESRSNQNERSRSSRKNPGVSTYGMTTLGEEDT